MTRGKRDESHKAQTWGQDVILDFFASYILSSQKQSERTLSLEDDTWLSAA